jgi:hypothetical protein
MTKIDFQTRLQALQKANPIEFCEYFDRNTDIRAQFRSNFSGTSPDFKSVG